MKKIVSRYAGLLLLAFSVTLTGCGYKDKTERFHISGAVTYDGKPVPAGSITFLPDVTQGNMGAPGFTIIKDGRYDTKLGDSPVGGPHEIVVDGRDGVPFVDALGDENPQGKPLFEPYSMKLDLPKKAGETVDLAVPKTPSRR